MITNVIPMSVLLLFLLSIVVYHYHSIVLVGKIYMCDLENLRMEPNCHRHDITDVEVSSVFSKGIRFRKLHSVMLKIWHGNNWFVLP